MFLTVREVAERLKISNSLVYQLIASKELACHRIGTGRGGSIRVSEDDLKVYLDGRLNSRVVSEPKLPARRLKHIRR